MKKYRYCNKRTSDTLSNSYHDWKEEDRKTVEKDSYKLPIFIAGIVIGFLIMLCGVFLSNDFIIGMGIMLMGITVILFPFTTPQTTAFFGYQKSKIIGRILGLLLVGVGIWVGLF